MSEPNAAIRVYLKDGTTVYDFDDAAKLRALLHDRPGHKPKLQGEGAPIEVAMGIRGPAGKVASLGAVQLRYIARSSISHVQELVA